MTHIEKKCGKVEGDEQQSHAVKLGKRTFAELIVGAGVDGASTKNLPVPMAPKRKIKKVSLSLKILGKIGTDINTQNCITNTAEVVPVHS